MASILIIGEDPDLIDPKDAPPGVTPEQVHAGLDGSRDRLIAEGHDARILLTRDAATVEDQVGAALGERRYDVVVIGAGLRTLPPMAEQFERLINTLRRLAPDTAIAFNSSPADSDAAARRCL